MNLDAGSDIIVANLLTAQNGKYTVEASFQNSWVVVHKKSRYVAGSFVMLFRLSIRTNLFCG
jgi:hypothetical protein